MKIFYFSDGIFIVFLEVTRETRIKIQNRDQLSTYSIFIDNFRFILYLILEILFKLIYRVIWLNLEISFFIISIMSRCSDGKNQSYHSYLIVPWCIKQVKRSFQNLNWYKSKKSIKIKIQFNIKADLMRKSKVNIYKEREYFIRHKVSLH